MPCRSMHFLMSDSGRGTQALSRPLLFFFLFLKCTTTHISPRCLHSPCMKLLPFGCRTKVWQCMNSWGRCVSHGEDRLQLENVFFLQRRALLENIIFMHNTVTEEWQGDGREGQIMSCMQVVKFDGFEHSSRKIKRIATE